MNRPVPRALRLLRGNPGKRPLSRDEPLPDPVAPPPPEWLSPMALSHWQNTAPALEAMGLLTAIDGAAFAEYCTVWARWQEAEQQVRKHGMVVRVNVTKYDKDGKPLDGSPATSPYVNIAHKALAQVRAYEAEFGTTPSSRSRVKVEKPKVGDKFSRFDRVKHA
jgi:P27 family predicted phage terminase small subunit